MKKIIFLILTVLLFSSVFVSAYEVKEKNETYYYLLEQRGYDTSSITNRYVNGKNLSEILNCLFLKEEVYDFDEYGNISGKKLLSALENKLGLSTDCISDISEVENKVITYISLFDVLDYYFWNILTLNGLEYEQGIISENNGKWLLTYGHGKTYEINEPLSFELKYEMNEVTVIKSEEKIIEIIPTWVTADISDIYNKVEISGQVFIKYDNVLILNSDGELIKIILTDKYEILRRTNRDITEIELVVIKGTFKKNMNVTAVAVERII